MALTFDDGPHPEFTPRVLDTLKARGVKATFCLVGAMAATYPDLVRRIDADGHALCNHSWNHDFKLGTWSEAAIRSDMTRTNNAIRAAVPGAVINYFRHPGGSWTKAAIRIAKELGMRSLHWTVDPQDWRKPGTNAIYSRVIKSTHPGAVILLHDAGGDRSQTIAALPRIITTLRPKYTLIALPHDSSTTQTNARGLW